MCSPSMAESICYFYAFIFLEIEARAPAAHGLAEQADRPAPLFDYVTGTDLPLGNNHGVESASTSAHVLFNGEAVPQVRSHPRLAVWRRPASRVPENGSSWRSFVDVSADISSL